MDNLSWINDGDLENAVRYLLEKAKEAKHNAENNFSKNVIDPFSAMFEISGFNVNYVEWVTSEKNRQAQKTLQNHIGDFHQKILGSVNGWDNLRTGNEIDLICRGRKIIAEVKNKHNTISGGDLASLYYNLSNLVTPKASTFKGFTAYYVSIIPKKLGRFDKEFTPSDKSKGQRCPSNQLIREIDGASFYSLVTGDDKALENLFDVLPNVIQHILKEKYVAIDIEKVKAFFTSAFA